MPIEGMMNLYKYIDLILKSHSRHVKGISWWWRKIPTGSCPSSFI